MSTPTTLLNPTQTLILEAIQLMKTRGRAIGAVVTEEGEYCPLGALAAVRSHNYRPRWADTYVDTPDVVAVAQAIYERFGPDKAVFSLVDFRNESGKHNWIHAYNDEIKEDAVMYAIMERAIEIAGETK